MPIGEEVKIKKTKTETNDFEITDPKYSIDDLILSEKTLNDLKSAIALKTEYEYVYKTLGFSETHKFDNRFIVNFYGAPGTGKTMAAHALAKSFGKKILIVDYSQIESKFVGDTPKNLKKVFEYAKNEDCVIFFDEADAILSRRVTNMSSATDTSVNQTRSVMLNIMNDFSGEMIFATNFISNYDSAFMRRILKHINFELPDLKARNKLFKKYIPEKIIGNINIQELSEKSNGLSGSDISNATLMAAFTLASEGGGTYHQAAIENQIKNTIKSNNENKTKPLLNSVDQTTSTRVVSEQYVKQALSENNR